MSLHVSNASALRAIQTSSLSTTTTPTAFVDTHGDFFRNQLGTSLTPEAGAVYNSIDGLSQWVRMNIPNRTFLQAKYWSVGAGGNDEAQGWGTDHTSSDAVKLATMGELNRRLVGFDGSTDGWDPGFWGPSIHLTSSITTSMFAVLSNLKGKNGSSFPRIYADPVPVDSGASSHLISAYQAAVPATNTERQMTVAGIGTVPTYVGKAVMKDDGTKFAWVTRNPSSGVLAISQPRKPSFGTWITGSVGTTTSADFANGESVTFYDMPSIPDWPFDPSVPFPLVANLRFGNTDNAYFPHGDLGRSSPYIIHCIFGDSSHQSSYEMFGGAIDSSGNGFLIQPLFTGSHNSLHAASLVMYSAASVNATASPFLDACQIGFYGELNIAGNTVGWPSPAGPGVSVLNFPQQNGTQIAHFGSAYAFGAFGLAPTDHHGGRCDFYMDDGVKWYGSVPGAAMAIPPNARVRLDASGITLTCPGSTWSGGPAGTGQLILNAGGTAANQAIYKNFSDVPLFDTTSGTSVAGHQ